MKIRRAHARIRRCLGQVLQALKTIVESHDLKRRAMHGKIPFDGTIPIPILPGLTRPDVGVPRQNLTDLHVFQMPRAHI